MFLDPRTAALCAAMFVMLATGAWIVTRNGPLYLEPPHETLRARLAR